MGRKALAVISGLIVAMGFIFVGEMIVIKWSLIPIEPGKNPNGDVLGPYFASVPAQGLLFLAATYAVAAFLGGFISIKMARRFSEGLTVPVVTAVLIMLFGAIDLFAITPYFPAWANLLCLLVCVPFAMVGYRFARLPKDVYRHSTQGGSLSSRAT